MPKINPIIPGTRYGRLIVLSSAEPRKGGKARANVICDCGNSAVMDCGNLRGSISTSCGCLNIERVRAANTKHGKKFAPIYHIWSSMLARCENPKNSSFKNYGGRGIQVCERWHSFEDFYADVGDPPDGRSLDRPDNMKGYGPDNWRWATRSEQSKNRRPFKLKRWGKVIDWKPRTESR